MRGGKSAPDALKTLLADAGREVRQVAMIDAHGRVAAYTGAKDIAAAGHQRRHQLLGAGEPDAERHGLAGDGQGLRDERRSRRAHAGGARCRAGRGRRHPRQAVRRADRRHRQADGQAVDGRVFDLRVDDNPEPLAELRRLVALQRAYNHMNAGDLAVEHKDNEAALREYSAAETLVPDNARDDLLARGGAGQHGTRRSSRCRCSDESSAPTRTG